MEHTPKFISLEGSEGAGKSTIMQWMMQVLEKHHISFVKTREPGGTPVAEDIRRILLAEHTEKMDAKTESLLMFATRVQNTEVIIKPALARGQWVLADRYVDASFAYQGGGRDLGLPTIDQLAKWSIGDFRPDLTILLDVPVEVGMERIKNRAGKDRIEQEALSFFQRVRAMYLALAEREPERFCVIDASQSLEQVKADVEQALEALMT